MIIFLILAPFTPSSLNSATILDEARVGAATESGVALGAVAQVPVWVKIMAQKQAGAAA
jgi:hypothetical protein